MTTTERSNEDKIAEIVSGIGFLSYRYLSYEHSIVNNKVDDPQLIEQQKEFVQKLHIFSEVLSEELVQGDMFICDVLGIASQLFAYTWLDPDRNSEEQWNFLRKFAMETEAFTVMMKNMGGSAQSIDSYMDFRCDQHSKIATVIRSLIKDFRYGNDKCKSHERFDQDFQDASAYLFFCFANCNATYDALRNVAIACLKYDLRFDGSDPAYAAELPTLTQEEVIKFVFAMFKNMMTLGDKLTRSTKPLTGKVLLKKLRSFDTTELDNTTMCLQCGYNKGEDENGEKIPAYEEFYEALLEAKGVELGKEQETKQDNPLAKPQKSSEPLAEEIRQSAYFKSLSEESAEVIEHFGVEAPGLLNKYSCAVEDALLEQVQRANALSTRVEELEAQLKAQRESPE